MPVTAPLSIGQQLREARTERRLSIEEAAWRTRIRPDILRALEREHFGEIEHTGFVRRHLASYARFLGIDAGELLLEYGRAYEPPDSSPIEHLNRRDRQAKKPPRPKWLVGAAVSAVLLMSAGILGVLGEETVEPTPPAGLTGSVEPRLADEPVSRGAVRPEVLVRLDAVDNTVVTVMADGRVVLQGAMRAGETRLLTGIEWIEVSADDGGAVRLTVNGVELGTPGEKGSAYRARFGPDGAISS